jgi:hypothetical protein
MVVYIFHSFNELDCSKYKHLACRKLFLFFQNKSLVFNQPTIGGSLPCIFNPSPSKEGETPLSMQNFFLEWLFVFSFSLMASYTHPISFEHTTSHPALFL